MQMTQGVLNIASTPIGNLKDITLRAIEVLKNSDLIISEDTRETQKILDAYNISAKQISYRDQNHDKVFLGILNDLLNGKKVTLVSDSGTPIISDPGFKLVRDLRKNSFDNIRTIPGPSAVISALSISGLPSDKFCFVGFLPKKSQDRLKELEKLSTFEGTLIFYESPQRLVELLNEATKVFGDRFCTICIEMTKMNERVVQGTLSLLASSLSKTEIKGEIVVLIAKEGFNYD